MSMSHGWDGSDRVELYFYDELPPSERAAFEAHLAGCAACKTALGELKEIRAALAPMRAQAERSEFEWRAFMRRLDARLDAEAAALARPGRSGLFAAAGIAAMLMMAVATGALWQKWSGPETGPSGEFSGPLMQPGDAGGSRPDRPTSREAAAEHLDRAKIVLLGLANKDSGAVSADDWAYERSLAASLLPDTRLHRLAALESGDAEMASLLNDLEVLMLQASFSAEPDRATLTRLQRYINRRDLLVRTELGL
jgi:Putative zinc-finger